MSKTMYYVDSFGQWTVKTVVKTSAASVWYPAREDPTKLIREQRETTDGTWYEDPAEALAHIERRVQAAEMTLKSRRERKQKFQEHLDKKSHEADQDGQED